MREFIVKKGVLGYVVNIGCQVAGFSTKSDLITAIIEYITDPDAMEKKHYHGPLDTATTPNLIVSRRLERAANDESGRGEHALIDPTRR